MSYTKQTIQLFQKNSNEIFEESINDNDITSILEGLNSVIDIKDKVITLDEELAPLWNEILSDLISSISTALSGHYRLATSGLRNVLELSCNIFFFYDHKIEYRLYSNSNFKADKYVTTLTNELHFFKTEYIKAFYDNIDSIETKQDSCSAYLNLTYGKLCDVVHGRFKTLTKTIDLKIEYNKDFFKRFESMYFYTLSAICLMYVLRFNDFSIDEINKLAEKSNAIKINK